MSHIMFGTVVPEYSDKERQFDQSAHCCTNRSCSGGRWKVESVSARDQLWRVSSATGGSYLVAGVTPACPWCGGDLLVASEPHVEPLANTLLQPELTENVLRWN